MNPRIGSGMQFYSIGIVVEDKTDDGDVIKVTPSEELPHVLGVLSDVKFDYNVQGKNHQGADVTSKVEGVAYVIAQWKNLGGTNQITAPNVYEGETVTLIKYGSSEEVYWTKTGREASLRRLENVIHAWSNLEQKGAEFDLDSSHWVRISSRDQIVHFHTSNNRTEKVGYDVIFDLANGTFQLSDTNKNSVFIDSVNGDMKVDMNRSIELNAPQIRVNGQEYVHTTTKELKDEASTIESNASSSVITKSGGSMLSESAGSHVVKGGGPVVITPAVAVG